jgi:hypothetical protein
VSALQDSWHASIPGQQDWQLCLDVPGTCSRLAYQYGSLFACCGDFPKFQDLRFVPCPAESQTALPTLLQQFFASFADLLLLFLGLDHQVHAHLFIL